MKVEISMFLRYGFLWYFLSYDASSIIWNFLHENALKIFVFSCKYTFGEPKTAYTARRTRKRRPKGAMSIPQQKARREPRGGKRLGTGIRDCPTACRVPSLRTTLADTHTYLYFVFHCNSSPIFLIFFVIFLNFLKISY